MRQTTILPIFAEEQAPAPPSKLWQVPGRRLSVRIALDIIDRIGPDVMAGFWAVPKRGAEVGGILLGRVRSARGWTAVFIESFVPVPCEHRRGPSYLLSDSDEARFAEAVGTARQSGASVVGYFRSHTRDELTVSAEDLALVERRAPEAAVVLLIRPHAAKPASAALFLKGEEAPCLEFTFSPSAPVRAPEPPAEQRAALPVAPPARRRRRFWRAAWVVAAILTVSGAAVAMAWRQPLDLFGRTHARAAVLGGGLALNVDRTAAGDLRLTWDRGAEAFKIAGHAVLSIEDGQRLRTLELNGDQLRTGTVFYAPVEDEVLFRLEVAVGERMVSESVRAVIAKAGETVIR